MLWLRRLAPIIVIVLIWFGYQLWDDWNSERRASREDRIALVTAQVWVATARFPDSTEKFILYRDSLLSASGLTPDDLITSIDPHRTEPEAALPLVQKIKSYVDSLVAIEDSLLNVITTKASDSAGVE